MKNERLKRLISAAMAAALCLSLAGCGKGAQTLPQTGASGTEETKEADLADGTAENSAESTFSGTGVEFPEFYEKEGDVISFQTEVIVSEEVRENGLRKLSAAMQKPDPIKALECLMGDVEITEKNEEGPRRDDRAVDAAAGQVQVLQPAGPLIPQGRADGGQFPGLGRRRFPGRRGFLLLFLSRLLPLGLALACRGRRLGHGFRLFMALAPAGQQQQAQAGCRHASLHPVSTILF